jgi:hypothetical protein
LVLTKRVLTSQNVTPGSMMIVPGSSFRGGFAIESIAQLLMGESIPRLDGDAGARACSAKAGNTLYFSDIPGIF